jgi:hypothetical protein
VWFQDEARIGQKGRVCHRWYTRGERPPGLADNRFTFAYLFGAMRAGTDEFAKTLAPDEHAAMFLDQAGWHGAKALKVPDNVTLMPIPPYSPQLNPAERVWEYMKERYLSLRLHADYEAIADAACAAWNRLKAEAGRLSSLTGYPWTQKVQT